MFDASNPKVSVIIATYNFGKYLPEALESVFSQTFPSWELIVVDDGSTDKTCEIVNPYLSDKRVKYIFQRNKGLPAARNTGIELSSGEYIQFLDADDLIHPEKFERQVQCLDRYQEVDVAFSEYSFFKDDGPKILIDPPLRKTSGDIKTDMLKGNYIVVNSPLSRRKAIDDVGGFDESLTSAEDWDLWLRMLLSGMVFRRLGEKLAFVRVHLRRMTENRLNMYSGRYRVIKKNLGNVPKGSVCWRSAKGSYVRSKLAVMRENLYRGKLNEVLRAILDKPYHISFRGIIDFMIETFLLIRAS